MASDVAWAAWQAAFGPGSRPLALMLRTRTFTRQHTPKLPPRRKRKQLQQSAFCCPAPCSAAPSIPTVWLLLSDCCVGGTRVASVCWLSLRKCFGRNEGQVDHIQVSQVYKTAVAKLYHCVLCIRNGAARECTCTRRPPSPKLSTSPL